MADMRRLERTQAENVTWNKARINFLAKFITALVQVKIVSLVQIYSVMPGRAKPDSHYKRCQRFLRFFDLPFAEVAHLVIKMLGVPAPFVISIDRTDWYLGDTPLNILMLSLVHKGVAFPVLWMVLEQKGCSDTSERIKLLEKYLKLFGPASLSFVTADREFIGREWSLFAAREDSLSHSHQREPQSHECSWQPTGQSLEPVSHTPSWGWQLAPWGETSLGRSGLVDGDANPGGRIRDCRQQ